MSPPCCIPDDMGKMSSLANLCLVCTMPCARKSVFCGRHHLGNHAAVHTVEDPHGSRWARQEPRCTGLSAALSCRSAVTGSGSTLSFTVQWFTVSWEKDQTTVQYKKMCQLYPFKKAFLKFFSKFRNRRRLVLTCVMDGVELMDEAAFRSARDTLITDIVQVQTR